MIPKLNPIRDRAYLDHLRTEPCIVSGYRGEGVDPAHIGTLGRGIYSPNVPTLFLICKALNVPVAKMLEGCE